MQNAIPTFDPSFHGSTGATAYDAIHFSLPPIAELVYLHQNRLSMVRHLGARGEGLVRARGRDDRHATMLVNLGAQGRLRAEVGGARIDKPLIRHHVSFIPAGTSIEIECPAGHSALLLAIPQDYLAGLTTELGTDAPEPIHAEPNHRLAQLAMMIDQEMRTPSFASDLMIEGLMRAIASVLVRRQDAQAKERVHLSPAKLSRVLAYIEANLDSEISLSALAAVAGLSPFHFSRTFKLATGESPYHYVSLRRLARAQQLLSDSQLPLVQIALECGFASQSHFTSVFSKALGTSPGRYRRESIR
ncbi:MAG: hypothetical protein A4S12_00025 [Proteobacteria bacterium SG_bin5]|nr:AraC family transcriptional regulator [Sphingomonas sp.]OQW41671.1 MAG: hypothetical protein A4S12_00025 [Proteobacteria bacterium SG_bin5]